MNFITLRSISLHVCDCCVLHVGNTLKRVHEANLLQAEIDRAKAEEKHHLEMWRRKVGDLSLTEENGGEDDAGVFIPPFDSPVEEFPDSLLAEPEEAVVEPERELTAAEKKAKKKAEKEQRKAENKEKNRTLKKIGKLIRRQSERGERERSSSEPTPGELSPVSDAATASVPGSETASLADETASIGHRMRGLSDGAVSFCMHGSCTLTKVRHFQAKCRDVLPCRQLEDPNLSQCVPNNILCHVMDALFMECIQFILVHCSQRPRATKPR